MGTLCPQPRAKVPGRGGDKGFRALSACGRGQAVSTPPRPCTAVLGLRELPPAARRPGAGPLGVPGARRAEPLPRARSSGRPLRGGPRGHRCGHRRPCHPARLRAAFGGARLLRRPARGHSARRAVPRGPQAAVRPVHAARGCLRVPRALRAGNSARESRLTAPAAACGEALRLLHGVLAAGPGRQAAVGFPGLPGCLPLAEASRAHSGLLVGARAWPQWLHVDSGVRSGGDGAVTPVPLQHAHEGGL
mmetsp:Transcript_113023/g.360985  ORF Transcript_113023/g.360985 Transcript_113023/m.360985 type:complete len:248 (-) Transcript_113023:1070-1813(-)